MCCFVLLVYADSAGGAKIYMGVETFGELPTEVWFVVGVPRDAFQATIRKRNLGLASSSRLSGWRLRWFDDSRYVHIGLEVPRDRSPETEQAICRALKEIAGGFGQSPHAEHEPSADAIRAHGQQAIMTAFRSAFSRHNRACMTSFMIRCECPASSPIASSLR